MLCRSNSQALPRKIPSGRTCFVSCFCWQTFTHSYGWPPKLSACCVVCAGRHFTSLRILTFFFCNQRSYKLTSYLTLHVTLFCKDSSRERPVGKAIVAQEAGKRRFFTPWVVVGRKRVARAEDELFVTRQQCWSLANVASFFPCHKFTAEISSWLACCRKLCFRAPKSFSKCMHKIGAFRASRKCVY